jgi:hypothetical protein
MRSDKEIALCEPLRIKTQCKMGRRSYETDRKCQTKTKIEKRKVLQGIKPLVPHRRLPLNLNAFCLLHLLLLRRLIGYSDDVLPLPTEDSLDMGNVECSED